MMDWLGIPQPADVWSDVVSYFSVSAFWLYLFYGALIIVGAAALAWLFPVLRSLAGAVIVAVVGMLYAYRRGEKDAEKREAARRAREQRRQQQQRPRRDPWDWWR